MKYQYKEATYPCHKRALRLCMPIPLGGAQTARAQIVDGSVHT